MVQSKQGNDSFRVNWFCAVFLHVSEIIIMIKPSRATLYFWELRINLIVAQLHWMNTSTYTWTVAEIISNIQIYCPRRTSLSRSQLTSLFTEGSTCMLMGWLNRILGWSVSQMAQVRLVLFRINQPDIYQKSVSQ